MQKLPLFFPKSFRFSVSTAAYQIEGNNIHSDWWEWEKKPGAIRNNDRSGVATDSRAHFAEDIANMRSLSTDVYRFSIEWGRIEPKEGTIDQVVIQDYLHQMDELLAAGIEPMVTLNHFTFPQWVAEKGGWEWNGITLAFEKFTRVMAKSTGKRVKLWVTINEPMSLIAGAYITHVFPPGRNDLRTIALPMENMVRAHAAAYHALHQELDTPDFKISAGIAHHLRNFDPYRPTNPLDCFAAKKFDAVFNWAIPNALITGRLKFGLPFVVKANAYIPEAIGTQDFFGLNFYSRDLVAFELFSKNPLKRLLKPGAPTTDLDWEIYPEGMKRLLHEINRRFPKLPIWITENGLADKEDKKRFNFIYDHLKVLSDALKEGLDIQGYCHWTLNDNFEWAEGWFPRFGLFYLEPETLKRVPRNSTLQYAQLIRDSRSAI